jgi:peptide deformylase
MGEVTRPNYVKCEALDENMEPYVLEGEELLARCICHECDHLDGIMYVSRVEGELQDVPAADDEE